jgi:glycerol-3-phosphate dehydrogenase
MPASSSKLSAPPGRRWASRESIVHLDDLTLRRTIMALLGQLSLDLLEQLAVVLAPVLEWSQERTQQEVARTVRLLSEVHGVKIQ